MVNMFLNYIKAMRPNFIAVDAMASDDPKKRAVSMAGIREVIKMVRQGDPVGFFPAGAVAKVNWRGRLQDREWQPTVIQLIEKLKVPVIPIFSMDRNRGGLISWEWYAGSCAHSAIRQRCSANVARLSTSLSAIPSLSRSRWPIWVRRKNSPISFAAALMS